MGYKKIGFIGSGKMAGAIIKGLLKSNFTAADNIEATQESEEGLGEKSKFLGVNVSTDNKKLVNNSDVIFIAVKPNQVLGVLDEIKSLIDSGKLVVSVAAGVNTSKLEANLPEKSRVIRVMPNTPALVGEGMSGIIGGRYASKDDVEFVKSLLNTVGECVIIDNESQMDIVTAISGSGPAFFYKVINDIARAGEKMGMPYEKALLLSIQTAIGSAKMAKHREVSMETLISNVATKGGCTKVGIDVMSEINTEEIFYDVIKSTAQKASELGKG